MDAENGENSNAISNNGSMATPNPSTPVHMRLYDSRHKADEERMTTREELFLAEMEECTFSPAIPLKKHEKHGAVGDRTPVWERLHDDNMSLVLLRDEIKASTELHSCTFQPKTPEVRDRALKKKLANSGFTSEKVMDR